MIKGIHPLEAALLPIFPLSKISSQSFFTAALCVEPLEGVFLGKQGAVPEPAIGLLDPLRVDGVHLGGGLLGAGLGLKGAEVDVAVLRVGGQGGDLELAKDDVAVGDLGVADQLKVGLLKRHKVGVREVRGRGKVGQVVLGLVVALVDQDALELVLELVVELERGLLGGVRGAELGGFCGGHVCCCYGVSCVVLSCVIKGIEGLKLQGG